MDDTGRPPSWLPRAVVTVAVVILVVLALLWMVGQLRSLIFQIFIALFIWIALEPAVQFLTKRGWKRSRATPVVFVATFVVVAGFIGAIVPVFVNQAVELAENMPTYIENIDAWLQEQDLIDIEVLNERIEAQFQDAGDLIGEYGGTVFGGVLAVGNTVFGAIFQMVVIGLFAYSMVVEGPRLRKTVLSVLPPERQREVVRIWEIAVQKTGGYIYSRLVLAVASAIYTIIVLWVLGVPHAVALGLWVGVLSQFVPVVGTYIAAVLPILVALFSDPISALWVLVALVGYQQIENFLIAPRISARAMAIHPAVSIGAVIAGGNLLGAVGAILALPVAATVQAAISTALQRHELIAEADVDDERKPAPVRAAEEVAVVDAVPDELSDPTDDPPGTS